MALQAAGLGVYNPAQHAVNGFMPTQLPGLQLWLDASRIGFTNGANVPVWLDYSGNAFDATNSTSSSQPVVGNINGRNSIKFDATDDWLELIRGTGIASNKQAIAIFAVAEKIGKQGDSANIINVSMVGNQDGSAAILYYGTTNATGNHLPQTGGRRLDANSFQGITNNNNSSQLVMCSVFEYTNAVLNLYVNGNRTNRTFQTTGNSQNANANNVRIGMIRLNYYPLGGTISEIVFLQTNPTEAQRLQVERYLGTKYGIVVQ